MNLDKKTKTYLLAAAGVVVVLGLWYWFSPATPLQNAGVSPENTSEEAANQQNQNTTQNNSNSNVSGSVATPKPSYSDAVNLYKDRRIQFNENCVALPTYATFKKGTTIMLDNRSGAAKSVMLDSTRYSIAPYDFALVTVTTSSPLPHTMLIDCNNGQNNARILIQQ